MAARQLGQRDDSVALVARENVPSIIHDVEAGLGWGVIAWENSVEGYVVPNLDAVIDADDIAGLARLSVDIAFDAFVRPSNGDVDGNVETVQSKVDGDGGKDAKAQDGSVALHEVVAHPHGLAQCKRFARDHHLTPVPASSNAAACRDVKPGQVALGPGLCGELYGKRNAGTQCAGFRWRQHGFPGGGST
ncbi:hypothetical protein OZX57_05880 [Bifidobacterium sp. ESL0682]|nr:prephenate dehydratase domain-containing protein [Bifidobacterium sp. ESL0682]WEV42746.1 hypothetical protein OZX57_05880 [Bifidobacterium sp. ESL0682]